MNSFFYLFFLLTSWCTSKKQNNFTYLWVNVLVKKLTKRVNSHLFKFSCTSIRHFMLRNAIQQFGNIPLSNPIRKVNTFLATLRHHWPRSIEICTTLCSSNSSSVTTGTCVPWIMLTYGTLVWAVGNVCLQNCRNGHCKYSV